MRFYIGEMFQLLMSQVDIAVCLPKLSLFLCSFAIFACLFSL